MGKRCRMCGCSYAVLTSAINNAILLKKIDELYKIEISTEDTLPTVICVPCSDTVDINWEFYMHVQSIQEVLLKEIGSKPQTVKKKIYNGKKACIQSEHMELPASISASTNEMDIQIHPVKEQNKRLPNLTNEIVNIQVPFTELPNNDFPILPSEADVDDIQVPFTQVQNTEFTTTAVSSTEAPSELPILTNEQGPLKKKRKLNNKKSPIMTNEEAISKQVPFTEQQNNELPILTDEGAISKEVPFTEQQNNELSIFSNEQDVDNIEDSFTEVTNTELPMITDEEDDTESIFIEIKSTIGNGSQYNSVPKLEVQNTPPDKNDEHTNSTVHNKNKKNQLLTGKVKLEYEWKCADCEILNTFSTTVKLYEHYQQLHQRPPQFACTDCASIFDNLSVFIEHVKTHRPSFKFCCNTCGQWFMTFGDLVEHRLQHKNAWTTYSPDHGNSLKPRGNGSVSLRRHQFKCNKCEQEFKTARGPAAHRKFGCPTTITSISTTKCFL